MLYLGADHGGFQLKERLKRRLVRRRLPFIDVGANRYDRDDDYPDIARSVAALVARNPRHRGLLLCRSGVGVCIVANKQPGIRAVSSEGTWTAARSRRDDDTNILCLGADHLTEARALAILSTWLRGKFRNSPRDRRRLKKIAGFERER